MSIGYLVMTGAYREGLVGQKIWRHQKYEFIGAIIRPDTGENMEYRHLIKDPAKSAAWKRSASNKFGRLMEGLKRGITGTQTIKLVQRSEIPKDRKVSYTRFVCNYRPQK